MPSQFQKYYEAVRHLESLATLPLKADYMKRNAKDPKIYLERTLYLLKLLGDPHRGFKYVHVTGTAGKGTTVAMIHGILHQAGWRVGSFMSPFATTSIEKIIVGTGHGPSKLIDPFVFAELTKKIKRAAKKMIISKYGRPSYFECFFALALLYFKKMRCDWVVLEVGLGGKFDATNIVAHSEVSAITNIGLDHTDILGKTLAAIARDKAGIIKPNSHFFTTENRPSLLKIFKNQCLKKHTKIHLVSLRAKRSNLIDAPKMAKRQNNNHRDGQIATVAPQDAGLPRNDRRHPTNVALAAAIGHYLGFNDKIITKAIAQTALPCRFEIIQKNPLVILDGAHNPLKIKSVMHNLKNLTSGKLYIIFASAHNKDATSMLSQLTKRADKIIFTQIKNQGRKFWSARDLAKLVPDFKKKIIEPNAQRALQLTLKKLAKDDILLITGSFYLAGELRKRWISEETILKTRRTT